MCHETSLMKKNNNIAGKLYSKPRLRHSQKGCLKDKYKARGSRCQILGGRRRKIKCSRPTWRKERVFDKETGLPISSESCLYRVAKRTALRTDLRMLPSFFSQKSNLCSVSFSCVDTANVDGLENCWDDWRKKKRSHQILSTLHIWASTGKRRMKGHNMQNEGGQWWKFCAPPSSSRFFRAVDKSSSQRSHQALSSDRHRLHLWRYERERTDLLPGKELEKKSISKTFIWCTWLRASGLEKGTHPFISSPAIYTSCHKVT